VVGQFEHTNIKKTASRQTLYNLHHLLFGDFTIAFSFFFNVVVQDRLAASIDLWQACAYRFTE
jgi:hypothetical protein